MGCDTVLTLTPLLRRLADKSTSLRKIFVQYDPLRSFQLLSLDIDDDDNREIGDQDCGTNNLISPPQSWPPPDSRPTWQPVTSPPPRRRDVAYVFSAYVDRRFDPVTLIVIGLARNYKAPSVEFYCRYWWRTSDTLDGEKSSVKNETVMAEFQYVPETHGRKYVHSGYTCTRKALRGGGDVYPYGTSTSCNRRACVALYCLTVECSLS